MRQPKNAPPIPIPPRVRSLVGARFGRLVVRFFAGMDKHRKSFWCCECDCGNFCRVPGTRLLGTGSNKEKGVQVSCGCARADPGIRLAARLRMPAKKRSDICRKMRKAVKNRQPAYSMDAHRAAELLGVTLERLEIMAKDGLIAYTYKRGALWLSSKDVSALIADRERKKNRCPLRAIFQR